MGSEIVVRGSQGSCAGASFPRVLQPPRACPSRPPRATAPLPSDPLTTSARLRSDHGVYFWFLSVNVKVVFSGLTNLGPGKPPLTSVVIETAKAAEKSL